jgi:hypothetical protein
VKSIIVAWPMGSNETGATGAADRSI